VLVRQQPEIFCWRLTMRTDEVVVERDLEVVGEAQDVFAVPGYAPALSGTGTAAGRTNATAP
jgi:hypothetical protein